MTTYTYCEPVHADHPRRFLVAVCRLVQVQDTIAVCRRGLQLAPRSAFAILISKVFISGFGNLLAQSILVRSQALVSQYKKPVDA